MTGDDDDDNVDAHSGDQNLSLPNQFLAKYLFQNISKYLIIFSSKLDDVSFLAAKSFLIISFASCIKACYHGSFSILAFDNLFI